MPTCGPRQIPTRHAIHALAPPHACVQVLSELVEAAPITALQRWQMHENLTKLEDMLGACERILKTPIPLAYSRHTHRFLIIWLTILPYALWATFDWATVAVAPLISLFLSGINEIGIDVEEPFSLLPLSDIADTALKNCTQIVNMQVCLSLARVGPAPRMRTGYSMRVALVIVASER